MPDSQTGSAPDGDAEAAPLSDDESPNGESPSDGPESRDSEDGSPSGDDSQDEGNPGKNALEWVVFSIGVAIVVGVLGHLGYQMVAGSDDPPRLVIELGPQTDLGGVVEIEVTVRNEGDAVAQGATVEVCGGPDTCAQLSFPYVPAKSTREGRVGLRQPLSGPLETRAVSFQL